MDYWEKGSKKVYAEGRLQTRKWTTPEGEDKYTTEVVLSEMIMLDPKGVTSGTSDDFDVPDDMPDEFGDIAENNNDDKSQAKDSKNKKVSGGNDKSSKTSKTTKSNKSKSKKNDDDENDDIPF